jgi:hypothetical protein
LRARPALGVSVGEQQSHHCDTEQNKTDRAHGSSPSSVFSCGQGNPLNSRRCISTTARNTLGAPARINDHTPEGGSAQPWVDPHGPPLGDLQLVGDAPHRAEICLLRPCSAAKQLLTQRCLHVSAAPIGDRRLDLGAGDATRIGLYLGKRISRTCRRRRPCAKEPACNQASPDRASRLLSRWPVASSKVRTIAAQA